MPTRDPRGVPAARSGFTLIEVLVAMTIAGMLLLGARALLDQLADGAERTIQSADTWDRDANAERMLRRLVMQVEAAHEGSAGVVGSEEAARLTTWCEAPAGWRERCTVTIGFIPAGDELALAILLPGGALVEARRGVRAGALRYLYSADDGGIWLRSWTSEVSTPLALGVLIDGDTLVVWIGERG